MPDGELRYWKTKGCELAPLYWELLIKNNRSNVDLSCERKDAYIKG
ncbi:hypothetical protein AA11826_2045 [Komagataeibacter oboediens DSM 11826]|nr:hypothetical protein AA11826_2045 [Komagataeibacter oboediens DSM 11826]